MRLAERLDRLHYRVRQNRWLHFFAVFNRIALAAGFIPSGMVKILGERFTDLTVNHPLGHFLDAFFLTGYYYTFVGVMQVTAAVLLLIPRTALLGAFIYLPIILNILVLSLSVRFQGSMLTAPLMLLANLYLLCWDYHKIRLIFPWNYAAAAALVPPREEQTYRFPVRFVAAVVIAVFSVVATVFATLNYALMPMNRLDDCRAQCDRTVDAQYCLTFCDCIHTEGRSLGECMDAYEKGLKPG
ncbi:putative membrane protein YphA (DoxX/SURF4 family) [Lewinella aquimaris]|uniref:Putative membrane protein YphA (DoxX/SURF4 family) n=1 Tax=Neolewinella aquimaris TaxID=1835722 RepID=A0A840EGK7_9BACT|nr:DoxX family protein [Neolewinella aquimaris]MBB4080949.1 putative membrane protein YphA (DoxX/SURF4 family) [Neolewinella aquimaris]